MGPKLQTCFAPNSHLVSTILGARSELHWTSREHLTNDILMSALGYNQRKDLKQIYTDIEFTVGRATTRIFFGTTFKESRLSLNVRFDEWKLLKTAADAALHRLNLKLLPGIDIESVDTEFQREWTCFKQLTAARDEVERMHRTVRDRLTNAARRLHELEAACPFVNNKDLLWGFHDYLDRVSRQLSDVNSRTDDTYSN